jgi:hypothetical protein
MPEAGAAVPWEESGGLLRRTPMPESQSLRECMTLRVECQKAIFEKIDQLGRKGDQQHGEVIAVLTSLRLAQAREDGQRDAEGPSAQKPVARRFPWREVSAVAILAGAAIAAAVAAAVKALTP